MASLKVMNHRLEWLGWENIKPQWWLCLDGYHIPPPIGPKKRWRDIIWQHLNVLGLLEWYKQTSQRNCWQTTYQKVLIDQCGKQQLRSSQPPNHVLCEGCGRSFHKPWNMARPKCIDECQIETCTWTASSCSRWCWSWGGLSVHKCLKTPETNTTSTWRLQTQSNQVKFL